MSPVDPEAPHRPAETETRSMGLLGSLRELVASIVGLVEARLELISSDIAEARARIVQLSIVVGVVVVCVQIGVLLLLISLVLSIPEAHRAAAVGIAGLLLLAGAIVGALWIRHRLKRRRPFFEATLAEFEKDRDKLRWKK
jgi:uncharacterized membrane protein YqjE